MEIIKTNIENIKIDGGILNCIDNVFKKEKALILRRELDKVDFAYYNEGKYDWLGNDEIEEDLVLDLRIFNCKKELHIYKFNDEFRARLIDDSNKKEDFYTVKEDNFMWGSKYEENKNSFFIKEDRGACYNLPKIFDINKNNINFKYRVVNYFEENEDGTLSNYDYRLVDILYQNSDKSYISILNGGDEVEY